MSNTQSLLDRIKNKRQAIQAKSGRERPSKLVLPKNVIRVLPSWSGDPDGDFMQDFGQHFIKGTDDKVRATYICVSNTFGRPCEVCTALAEAASRLDPNDEVSAKLVHEARGGNRVLINAIYRNGPHAGADKEPVILELPPTVVDGILAIGIEYAESHGINIFALENGYDLTIEKTGTGRDTEYKVMASPVATKVPDAIIPKLRNLADFAKQEYDQGLQAVLTAFRSVIGSGASSVPALVKPVSQAQRLAESGPMDMEEMEGLPDDLPQPTASEPVAAATVIESTARVVQKTPEPAATPTPTPTPTPAATPTSAQSELDELDALLADV